MREMARSNRGFTLLEVMIALAVAAISLVTLISAHTKALTLLAGAEDLTEVTILAREEMERLYLTPPVETGVTEKMKRDDYPDYKWQVETRPTPFDGVFEVVLSIYSADEDEKVMLTLRTYMEAKA